MIFLFRIDAPGSDLDGETFSVQDVSADRADARAVESVKMTFALSRNREATATRVRTFPSYAAYHKARDSAYESGIDIGVAS